MMTIEEKVAYWLDLAEYDMETSEQQKFVAQLMPMNIEARYPEYKEQLARMLSKERCRTIIDETKQLQQWIKSKLSNSSADTSKS